MSEERQNKLTYNEVRYRQALPYEIKIRMSETRLREFIGYYGEDGVAVSFSGGLDSTFALAFIRERYPRVKAVSVLAIECKQNIDLIMKTENVQPIPPRYSQKQVIEKFGFPVVSKKVAKALQALQNPTEKNAKIRNLALTGITSEGRKTKTYKLANKWRFLIKAPFKISNKCCYYMKETPIQSKPLPAGYYNMDCMAALPLFPDDFFDIAVIDAPYGIGADNMAMGTNKTRKKNGYPAESTAERVKKSRKENGAGKWDNQVPPPEYFTELFRVSKHCIIWGGNYYDLPPTRGVIVWDKLQPWEAFSQVEIAWTDYDRPAAIVKLSNTGGANTEKKIHTTQKPPELYGWLFSHYLQLKRGARFLDTHVGSASSLMAAHDAGLQPWGFEKDAYYYGLSADRLERHKAQYNIFQVAEQMEIEL